ncbi:MAG: BON domain-containing protein [Gemmataceae bacterium]
MCGHISKWSGVARALKPALSLRSLGIWTAIGLTIAGISMAASAAPPSPGSDPTAMPSLHDTRLAVQARNALVSDAVLAPLVDSSQIGVRVRHNVAILFGSVPSQEVADKAVECLRGIQKLLVLTDIRSELEIVVPTLDPRIFKRQVDKEAKAAASPVKPSGELASLNGDAKPLAKKKTTTVSPHVDLKGPEGLRIGDDPRPGSEPSSQGVKLLPPVPLAGEASQPGAVSILPPKPLPPPRSLSSQIEELRKKDDRFAAIRVRVEAGKVFLAPSNAENLFDFAEAISRLSGATRVIVER